MSTLWSVILCLLLLLLAIPPVNATSGAATPVVVELFTSEGCSSCPPADALLAKLGQQHALGAAEVLVLGEHVDYWNHLGWSDRFSSRSFTERQEAYAKRFGLASAYTPQMVIDGRFETVGSDSTSVARDIEQSSRAGKMARVGLAWTGNNVLRVAVDNAGSEPAAVMLAVTEDSLSTKVGSGENGGRLLRHSGVVRQLRRLGTTADGTFLGNVPLSAEPGWKPDDLRIIVFVQKSEEREIVGAAQVRYR
jgi:hypothetical protein